jgi:hypothetical protein
MMTDSDFDEFVESCYEEMEIKQRHLFDEFGVGSFERYWLEGETRTLDFISIENVKLSFKIIYIGTWSHLRNTWMWGWFNESLTDEIRMASSALKVLNDRTGYEVFTNNGFECDEEMAYELTAMSLNQLNAVGMYKVPGQRSHLFLALMERTD